MRYVMVKRLSSVILVGILLGFPVSLFSEGITLEQVIQEVCTKSDSAKMMKESIVRSDAMVRENWAAVYPKLSFATNTYYSSPFKK